jgi:diaminohydroxyphosphoribosylaminopyrimidine deaminase / 5-amino-6-(5-phosphoribosylamino)uracil reductase
VAGVVDPSPEINGRGLELLRSAGIAVDLAEGDLARRLKRQNDGARKAVMTGLPFVTYKYAMTVDGRTATDSGDSRWISSAESRELVHTWRGWSDAVMVGAGTVRADDPRLTARAAGCTRQPLRVVADAGLCLPREAALVETVEQGPVLAVCGPTVSEGRRHEVESWGVEVAVAGLGPDGHLEPEQVARMLVGRGVQNVLLEGGARLAGSWWEAGLVDKVAAFVCPCVVSGTSNRAPLNGPGVQAVADGMRLREVEVRCVGPDVLVSGYLREPF